MAIIADVLELVDDTVSAVGSDAFTDVADAVIPVFRLGAVLLVVIAGINFSIQAVPVTFRNVLSLVFRICVVSIFIGVYSNFDAVYGVITDTPSRLGSVVLEATSGGTSTSLYDGLDDLYVNALSVGEAVSENGSWISGALASLVLFIIAALMATISIIVICGAKLMIAVLIVIGPLAIVCSMFKQSASIFDAWVKLAVGFAFVPLLTAAMAGFTIATAEAIGDTIDVTSIENIGDVLGFVVVMFLGAGLMLMVPTIAQTLGSTTIGLGQVASSTHQLASTPVNAALSKSGNGLRGVAQGATGINTRSFTQSGGRALGRTSKSLAVSSASLAVNLAKKSVGSGK